MPVCKCIPLSLDSLMQNRFLSKQASSLALLLCMLIRYSATMKSLYFNIVTSFSIIELSTSMALLLRMLLALPACSLCSCIANVSGIVFCKITPLDTLQVWQHAALLGAVASIASMWVVAESLCMCHQAVQLSFFMGRSLWVLILGIAYLLSGSTAKWQQVYDYYCDLSSVKELLLFSIEIVCF